MEDRIPTLPGRVKLTRADGTSEYVTIERADEPTNPGTPLNKATLLSDQVGLKYGLDSTGTVSQALALNVYDETVNLPADKWVNSSNPANYFTNSVTLATMKEAYNPIVSLDISKTSDFNIVDAEKEAFALITFVITRDGVIHFWATEKPETSINVRIKGV